MATIAPSRTAGAVRADRARTPHRARTAWRTAVPLLVLGALYAVFFLWPILSIALRSLSATGRVSYTFQDFSFANYESLVRDERLRGIIVNTVRVSTIATVLTFVLAFPSAYLISRLGRRTATTLLLLILLPFWVSILVRLFAFVELLSAGGPVNSFLGQVGIGRQHLLFNTTGTVIGMVNYLLPYLILILYSAMSGVDPNLQRAAKSLGASSWKAFRSVYLPLIRNAVVGGVLLTFIIASGFFLTPAILGGPRDVTISTYIAQQVQNYQWGAASAFGIFLLVVTLLGFAVAGRMTGLTTGASVALGGSKGTARPSPMPFGPTKIALWVAMAAVLVVLIAPLLLVLPLSWGIDRTIGWPPRSFTLDWYAQALTDPLWTGALKKSLSVATAVAVLCLVLALAASRAVTGLRRHPMLQSSIVSVLYLPLVAPIILLAIGTFDVQTSIHALGTWWGLVLAETVLALPFTYIVVSAALANLDPSLEKAAWTMGASRLQALRRVTVPLVIPSLLGAGLLAFISSWDEAVVALFQTGFDKTLPVMFFASVKSGSTPVIAAIGVMLMLLIIVGGGLWLLLTEWRTRSTARRTSVITPTKELS